MLGIRRALLLFTVESVTSLPSNEGAETGSAMQLTSREAQVTESTLLENSPHSGNYAHKMLNGYLRTTNAAKQSQVTEFKSMYFCKKIYVYEKIQNATELMNSEFELLPLRINLRKFRKEKDFKESADSLNKHLKPISSWP